MNVKYWILSVLMLPLFVACSEEDDIDAIFMGRTWKLTTIMQGKQSIYEPNSKEQKEISESTRDEFVITFSEETFNGQTKSTQFNGSWSVDGSNHTIGFYFNNLQRPSGVSGEMINIMEKATKYEGDINQLSIHAEGGRYLLLEPLR